ncbi:MAG: UTP--glucose-1-phosphate uridylyltransferase GalU [Rhodospirillales bacterium]|jgi:UTP--glucose-1-phosphate uridylyltransferase|nr:UTP--glucose-1-phosphate uridylyltransferase GalU [Rhodospirillales bacterium]
MTFKPVKKAIFPVAGLGTRFLPATKALPKEMLPIVDKPLIQYAVEEARDAGIEQFIFVTGRGKGAMEDHFDHAVELEQVLTERDKLDDLQTVQTCSPPPGQLAYVRQQKPLGLGHAVWCGRNFIGDEPFAVLSADDLILAEPGCLKQMIEVYNQVGGNVVAVEDVPREHTNRYGILDIESDDGKIAKAKALIEKPDPKDAPSTLSIIGRYILQPAVLRELDKHETGVGGEIQLTDAMASLIGSTDFHGTRFEGKRFDCGSRLGFIEANIAFALSRDDMAEGVSSILKEYG